MPEGGNAMSHPYRRIPLLMILATLFAVPLSAAPAKKLVLTREGRPAATLVIA